MFLSVQTQGQALLHVMEISRRMLKTEEVSHDKEFFTLKVIQQRSDCDSLNPQNLL